MAVATEAGVNLDAPLATASRYVRRLMVDAAVWRKTTVSDGGGGQETTWVDQQRTVPVQLVDPSDRERETAQQAGVEITHTAVMPTDTDVARGDRLVVPGQDDPVELVSDPQTATHSAVARAPVKQEPWNQPI